MASLRPVPLVLLLAAAILRPAPTQAFWPDDGVSVDANGGRVTSQSHVRLSQAASGDLFVAFTVGTIGSGASVRRIQTDGTPLPSWGASHRMNAGAGAPVEQAATQSPTSDDGLWLASWSGSASPSNTVHLQRVASNATVAPATTPFVWPIQSAVSTLASVDAAPDGADGVYAVWRADGRVRLQRRLGDGSVAPGWSAVGKYVGTSDMLLPVALLPDGSGGAVVAWIGPVGTNALRVLRVQSDSTVAPGWPASGLPMSDDSFVPLFDPYIVAPMLVRSGPDHYIAAWAQQTSGEWHERRIMVQRFGLDGVLDPAWPAEGLVALEGADSLIAATIVADGVGGVHVASRSGRDWRSPYVYSHLDASGQFLTPNGPAGVSPVDAGASLVGPIGSKPPVIAAAPGGGLWVGWDDARHGVQHVRVRALLADGSADPAEPDTGRVASGPRGEIRALLADGAGGVYVAFARYDDDLFAFDIRVQRLFPWATLAAPPVATSLAIRLGAAWPQPARGAFSVRFALAGTAAARLELFDLSGRRIAAREVAGIGEQTVRFELPHAVSPGLYALRLTQGEAVRTARVVLTR